MTRNLAKHTLYAAAILTMLSACNSTHAQNFTPLGDLPGGDFNSTARGISADGSTVIGWSRSYRTILGSSNMEAFRWTRETGMVAMGDITGGEGQTSSGAFGVSQNGSVIVGHAFNGDISDDTAATEAFRWTSADGMVGLGNLLGDPSKNSLGLGVSADGMVVVGESQSADGTQAFRWTSSGGMVGLGDLAGGGFYSVARAVSADGSVIAGFGRTTNNGTEAFRWDNDSGMVGLGDLPGGSFHSSARGISSGGTTIVGDSRAGDDDHREAFRWTSETGMESLGDLAGGTNESWAVGATADGSIIVGRGNSEAGNDAFIWDSVNGMRSIQDLLTAAGTDMTGWRLRSALSISENGLVVGHGINPDGNTEAWVADLSFTSVPEPTSMVLLGFTALAIAARRRRFVR